MKATHTQREWKIKQFSVSHSNSTYVILSSVFFFFSLLFSLQRHALLLFLYTICNIFYDLLKFFFSFAFLFYFNYYKFLLKKWFFFFFCTLKSKNNVTNVFFFCTQVMSPFSKKKTVKIKNDLTPKTKNKNHKRT